MSNDNDIAALRAEMARDRADRAFAETIAETGVRLNATQRSMLRQNFNPDAPEATRNAMRGAGWLGPSGSAPQAQHGYHDPGAPSSAAPDPNNADSLHGSDIRLMSKSEASRLRREGRLMEKLREFRNSLPDGGSSLFQKRGRR